MAEMTAVPIYGKNLKKIFSSGPNGPLALKNEM